MSTFEFAQGTRRDFVKGAGAAAALGLAAGSLALAAEPSAKGDAGSYTFADTVAWDASYDVVVAGMGFAGMAAAMAAADAGASVLICEKAPDGVAGGNSRVCGQLFANTQGDVDAALAYYTALAAGREVPEDMLQILAEDVAGMEDRFADMYDMDRSRFTDQTEAFNGWMSPEYPEFADSEKVRLWATQEQYGQSYLYQYMRERIAEKYPDKIDVWFETPAVSLVQDPQTKTIVGVTVSRAGEERNVRAESGVCLCTGGFECNRKMVQDYLGLTNHVVGGGTYNEGDGLAMAQAVGCRLWHMDVYEGIGGNWLFDPSAFSYTALPNGILTGSSMTVGGQGRRFYDETLQQRHGHVDLGNGEWECPEWPASIYIVFDQAKMDEMQAAAPIDGTVADAIVACASVSEAAEAIGCPGDNLQATLDDFNDFVAGGRDYTCGRDVSTMRAFDGKAYYVLHATCGILNTQGGPERNARAEVLDTEGSPIPHLYSAGELGGMTAHMYQGGTNVAECFIFGNIAGTNAAAEKDPLPAYEALAQVKSSPAGLGDETDLSATTDAASGSVNADGSLSGSAKGMGGQVPVTVTLDADGKIASVEVGENTETKGIGTQAIDKMPEEFVGLATADEIDGVDGVSGATVTSNALKAAVKAALGL